MGPGDLDLRRISEQLDDLLRRATSLTMRQVRVTKADDNPQTNLDTGTDTYLRSQLARVADVPIMSEEDESPLAVRPGLCWVLDPIDGTINAIAGTDDFAISVALVDTDDLAPLVGAVYLPRYEVLYSAVAEIGGRRDGVAMPLPDPEHSAAGIRIVSFGVPKDIPGIAPRMAEAFHRILARGWVTRQSGSASIDICRVAAGTWSAFFEYRLMYWDFVAATLVAREAGCHTMAVPSGHSLGVAEDELPLEYDLIVARSRTVLDEVAEAIGIDFSSSDP